MAQLHEHLAAGVDDWRNQGYPCDAFPTIAEILEWSHDSEAGSLRFLRRPQLRAVETYWYLRLVLNTPHIFDLYRHFCPRPRELRRARETSRIGAHHGLDDIVPIPFRVAETAGPIGASGEMGRTARNNS